MSGEAVSTGKNAITDRLSLSSILENLLQINRGTSVVRSSFDLFDKAIQELIFECHVEPVAKREIVSQLWTPDSRYRSDISEGTEE